MKRGIWFAGLWLSICSVAFGFRQELAIRTGDVLSVVVTAPAQSTPYGGDFTVQQDGYIYGFGFNRLKVDHLSVPEAQHRLRLALKRLIKPDEVLLTLKSKVTRRVFITGIPAGVAGSGTVPIVEKLTLRQTLAGLASAKDADLYDVRVFRDGKQLLSIRLERILDGTAINGDLPMAPDDVVSISSVPTERVWIAGSVRNPGPQVMPADSTIDQAIAQAGGIAIGANNEALASRPEYRIVLRRGTTVTPFPLSESLAAAPVVLEAGDTVTVEPPERNTIVLAGEVKTPGQLFLKPNSSLLDAIAEAGGTTPDGSASNVIVYRNEEPLIIDTEINADVKPASQFMLRDGDTVIVRKNTQVVYVFGEVLHQGKIPYPSYKPFRVTDALAESGGLAQNGSLRRVFLARPQPDGHLKITQFNLDEFIKNGKQEANPQLKSGDILLFGQPKPTFLTSVTQVVGSLLFVDSIAGAIGLRTTFP